MATSNEKRAARRPPFLFAPRMRSVPVANQIVVSLLRGAGLRNALVFGSDRGLGRAVPVVDQVGLHFRLGAFADGNSSAAAGEIPVSYQVRLRGFRAAGDNLRAIGISTGCVEGWRPQSGGVATAFQLV